MQENNSSRHDSVTEWQCLINGQTTSQAALTEVENTRKQATFVSREQSPSPLHHTFLLGRARFTAQPSR